MFDDDDLPKKKTLLQTPDLSDFSIDELHDYKSLLEQEIERVEVDIEKKSDYSKQLNAFFKE